jgi:alpha-glucosidase (family GH31 glycosyl hydrolase)
VGVGPAIGATLYSSPMVLKRDPVYGGPSAFERRGPSLSTAALRLRVDTATGCIWIKDSHDQDLTTLCPWRLSDQRGRGLSLKKNNIQNVYGIAQYFVKGKVGQSDGDWLAYGAFSTENGMGNAFAGFPGDSPSARGANSQIQFPVMYAIASNSDFAFFFDNVYKQDWNFRGDWIEVRNTPSDQGAPVAVSDPALRFYFIAGGTLLDVRKGYMELVGTPPVPPRKAFGLWLSEFGRQASKRQTTAQSGGRGYPAC